MRGEERCDLAAWVREEDEAGFKKGSGEGGGRGRWPRRAETRPDISHHPFMAVTARIKNLRPCLASKYF
jgi:hypothetical protein